MTINKSSFSLLMPMSIGVSKRHPAKPSESVYIRRIVKDTHILTTPSEALSLTL